MPFRLDENSTKVQFQTSMEMPMRVYQACLATGVPSNTRYYQVAVCEKLSKDLGIPLQTLLDSLPPTRGQRLFGGTRKAPDRGRNFTNDAVK